jgi:CheY-like chemotaxis protein
MSLKNTNILIVDDMEEIHVAYKFILETKVNHTAKSMDSVMDDLFEDNKESKINIDLPHYNLDSCYQGEEAIIKVKESLEKNDPYALVFMDMRMPPGLNGIETIKKIWEIDPKLEIILCTAFSDYNWKETINYLGCSDQLLLLKKPFETPEIQQAALAQVLKWNKLNS